MSCCELHLKATGRNSVSKGRPKQRRKDDTPQQTQSSGQKVIAWSLGLNLFIVTVTVRVVFLLDIMLFATATVLIQTRLH
ncbi:unnamed protein product [Lathyrus oleraceus]